MDKFDKPGKAGPRCVRWARTHPYATAGLLIFVALAFPFTLRRHSEWDDVYFRAARHLRAGEGLYHAGEGYVYPPFPALVALPFSYLPAPAGVAAWYAANVGFVFMLCHFAWRLSGGREKSSLREHLVWLAGLACGLRYVFDCLAHQQTDLAIAALLMAGCWALVNGRGWLAAASFGVGAGAKCTPLLWGGYLLWRRRWGEAVALVAVAIAVNLLPNLLHTPAGGGLCIAEWAERYLLPSATPRPYPYSEQIYNQSIGGAVHRWLTTGWDWGDGGLEVFDRAGAAAPAWRKWGIYGVEMALVLASLAALGRRTARRADPRQAACEYSVVLLLMVLLSPMSSKSHFCTLLLPGFCIARQGLERRSRLLGIFLALAILAGASGIPGLAGDRAASLAMWCGNVTWSAVILLGACSVILLRPPAVPPASPPRGANRITVYPLMTPTGRIRATFLDSPARSTTSTTSSTFL
jgi:hypothetical protein